MKRILTALFASEVKSVTDVGKIEEGHATSFAVEAARALLAELNDAPVLVAEAVDGFIVAGARSAILFGDTGAVVTKELPKADEKAGALHGAATVHLQKLLALLKGNDEATALIKKAIAAVSTSKVSHSDESLNIVLARTAGALKPGAEPAKLAAAVEAAKQALAAGLAESIEATPALVESLSEMAMAPYNPYNVDCCVNVDGVSIEIGYGGSIRVQPAAFVKDAPNHALAEFVVERAIRSVMEGDVGASFITGVRAALKASDKVGPLEIELRESTETVVETTEIKPVQESTMGTVTEDDSIAVVVVGESALELRAGDANGKVLVSVPVKDGNVDEAQVALDAAAAKLGYVFVPTTDATEMAEAAEMFVLSALLANRDLLGSHSLAAFESAVKAVDLARMADLIESLFEARSVEGLDGLADLVEGLRTKAKTKGRKPSGKTMVRKATTKSPALPVSTGPGQRHGGRVGGAADAGQGKAIIPPAQNPASHKDTPSGTRNQDVDWVKEEWVDSIRRMSVEEFTGHMLEAATVDSDDRFALRVAALTEAYKGPGKKDIAKKITAANPVIKKRAGKGLNLEAIQSEGTTVIEFARARVNEFLAVSKEVGAGSDAEVRMTNEAVSVRLPKAIAAKVLAVFTGDDVKVDAE